MSAVVIRQVAGASLVLAAGILAGRAVGLVREAALAARLGATGDADVAVLVLTFPDLVATFLITGAVPALLVPRFREAIAGAPGRAAALLRDAQLLALLAGATGAALVAVLAAPVVLLLAPGFGPAARDAAVPLIALTGLALPFAALTAVAGAYLQARGRFALPAFGTVLFNAVLVVAIVLAAAPGSIGVLAVAIVVASVVRWAPQVAQALVEARGSGWGIGPVALRGTDPRRLARAYVTAFGGTSVIVALPFVARALASLGTPGDVALLNYAMRIVDLPVGALATVGSVAALPHLSERFASGDRAGGTRSLRLLVIATAAVTTPTALALAWVAIPLAAMIYGRGAMDAASIERIGALAAMALVSLPAQGIAATLLAAFAARRALGFPFAASVVGLVLFALGGGVLASAAGIGGVVVAYVVLHWALAAAYALRLRADGIDVLRANGHGDVVSAMRELLGAAR